MILPHINEMVSLCAAHGITHAIISPGSRSAAISLAFEAHAQIEVEVVSDERSAAFIALGMAQQLRLPVVLVCTSGSAVYNYAPAVAEAFYQEVPLLIISADRPPEWTNQYDGQTIQQAGIFGQHVKNSFQIPVDVQHPDAQWQVNRIINEAILESKEFPLGPIHLNIPLREPFYPEKDEMITFPEARVIQKPQMEEHLAEEDWEVLRTIWHKTDRKMIVVGQMTFERKVKESLEALAENVVVLNEVTGNMHDVKGAIMGHDGFLSDEFRAQSPQLLITLGLSLISKQLKIFLRRHQPQHHWHIHQGSRLNDGLKQLTHWIPVPPAYLLSRLAREPHVPYDTTFRAFWQNKHEECSKRLHHFMQDTYFGEFQAIYHCLMVLPKHWQMHLANSLTVRYVNFLNTILPEGTEVYCNRGTSGIDGCTSTAVGNQHVSNKHTLLITGDVAFLYDKNAFWNELDLRHLRILVINNAGGSIFKMIRGPKDQKAYDKLFQTHQTHDARLTAQQYDLAYTAVRTADELKEALPQFLLPSDHGHILEVFSAVDTNEKVLDRFKQTMKNTFEGHENQ